MIRIANTPNLTGVTINGDYDDLTALVEAIHQLTVSDFDEDLDKSSQRFLNISLRVLGFAYDVRHAVQGDREVYTEANGLSEWHAEAWAEAGRTLPRENLRYACNTLYPESILNVMALNDLIEHRMSRLAIQEAVREYGCDEGDVRFHGLDCPEEIEW
jgi:hypothetical protein